MGARITIDSATLMNKGLEVIEAHWLFDVPFERIEVVVHPQSIVHALVRLRDGALLAHLGLPDMRVPIAYALAHPRRASVEAPRLDLTQALSLTFEPADTETFRCLALARAAGVAGGLAPCALNAADEEAVAAFLDGRCRFADIPALVERALETCSADALERARAGARGRRRSACVRAPGARGGSARLSASIAIGGLLALVFIHELGHFLAAKSVGMRVTKFYVGFPPAVVKRTVGATEYGIGLIPLGGFVRIVGMGRPRGKDLHACSEAIEKAAERRHPQDPDPLTPALERARTALDSGDAEASADALARLSAALESDLELIDEERVEWCRKELKRIEEDADPRAYWRQATWRRITAIVAGPAANVLAALVLLVTFYGLGVPKYVPTSSVQQIQADSPAQRMGLKPGDVVIGAQGKPITDVQKLRQTIATSPTVTLRVRRDGAERTLGPATPRTVGDQRLLGFVFDVRRDGTLHFGAVRSVKLAGEEVWLVTKGTGIALKELVWGGDRSNVQGVVGIVREQSNSVGDGLYLEQLAWLSLSLALFNLLPFLPLDGGHVLFALIERLRRKPLPRELYERVSLAGIAVFLLLFLLVLQQDVSRIIDGARPGP